MSDQLRTRPWNYGKSRERFWRFWWGSSSGGVKRTRTYHNQQPLIKCGAMSVINAFLREAGFGNKFDKIIDRRLSLVPVFQLVLGRDCNSSHQNENHGLETVPTGTELCAADGRSAVPSTRNRNCPVSFSRPKHELHPSRKPIVLPLNCIPELKIHRRLLLALPANLG